MIKYYFTENNRIIEADSFKPGCWINVVDPSDAEVKHIVESFDLLADYVRASLDEEESSRVEKEERDTLILIDTPIMAKNEENNTYYTIPLGIIYCDECVITISTKPVPALADIYQNKVRDCNTNFKTNFIFKIMLRVAANFLLDLKQIDRTSNQIEKKLRESMKNTNLIQLLEINKSLVYFSTALKSNTITLRKVSGGRYIKLYEEDQELLDDVLIEFNQAEEMTSIYLNILSGTMDAFASIISNNLNIVMKRLASITIIIGVPTVITGAYGMNVPDLPFSFFWFPMAVCMISMLAVSLLLWRKDLF
ncbi:MAG: magnesium transporter CorA family protein [Erysipelotrichaceae bacterium]